MTLAFLAYPGAADGAIGPAPALRAQSYDGSDQARFRDAMSRALQPGGGGLQTPGSQAGRFGFLRHAQAPRGAASPPVDPLLPDLHSSYSQLLSHAYDMQPGFDVRAPASAAYAVRRMVRENEAVLRYDYALQACANLVRSIKALTNLQG